jgi:predicted phage terminase large subunit-like protein
MVNSDVADAFEARLKTRPELNGMSPEWRLAFKARTKWLYIANKHQIPPAGDWWSTWLLLAGRGAGKTRAAAEWTWWEAWSKPKTRWLVSAPTSSDVRDVCFVGDSGLINVIPYELLDNYTRSLHEIRLKNGSLIKGIPASEPTRFRGPQFHGGWADELASWDYLDDAWNMIQFGLRLGNQPRMICTTTPKPKPLIVDLVNRDGDDVVYTAASTYDNIDNLAPTFKNQILQYEGTTLGRQEIYAEIIDPEEAGIIKRAWFRLWDSHKPLPRFEYVIQSYDVATSDKTKNDPTACTTWGVFRPSTDEAMSVMLIDCWEEYMTYPDLRPKLIEEAKAIYGDENEFGQGKKVDLILIEDKSAGISLIQDLQRAGLPVRGYNPGMADKMQRLNVASPIIAKGRVYIPESQQQPGMARSWAEPLIMQLCSFPEVRHDDLMDSATQALRILRDMGWINVDPLPDDDDDDDDDDLYYRKRRSNPYAV